jgi:protoporphyrinogen oxidase
MKQTNLNIKIIGSGISGTSIGRMLRDKNDILILEKSKEPGGLIKCSQIDGVLFHMVGGHVFNSKNEKVLEWFWNIFDKENDFISAKRNAKILINGNYVGYPIENYVYQLPKELSENIFKNLLKIRLEQNNQAEPNNFKNYLIQSFGTELYDLYFGPYNNKIWRTALEDVPLEWLNGKLPMPRIDDILLSNLTRQEESNMVHSSFFYPKKNGSQYLIDKILDGTNIRLDYQVKEIYLDNNKLNINNNEYIADVIIYTGDIRALNQIIKIEDDSLKEALKSLESLESNGTTNILCYTDETDLSWLYIPESKFIAHRIIYTGNFSANNNGPSGRSTCVVEFSGKHEYEDVVEELKKLPGNLVPISHNFEKNSYIVHKQSTKKIVERVRSHLRRYNIFLLGRFAEWEYYNMDKCIESAFATAIKIERIKI